MPPWRNGIRNGLKIRRLLWPCGFNSHRRHHKKDLIYKKRLGKYNVLLYKQDIKYNHFYVITDCYKIKTCFDLIKYDIRISSNNFIYNILLKSINPDPFFYCNSFLQQYFSIKNESERKKLYLNRFYDKKNMYSLFYQLNDEYVISNLIKEEILYKINIKNMFIILIFIYIVFFVIKYI